MPLPSRILIIRPSALGDVCRTVPVLASLRRAFPNAWIAWLVQDAFATAIEAHPDLDELVLFPRNRFARWWKNPRAAMEIFRWISHLFTTEYDLVVDCQGLVRSGLMTLATGAPHRVGLRSAREFAWLAYTVRIPKPNSGRLPVHTVDQMLSLLGGIGVKPVPDLRLYVAPKHDVWLRQQLALMGLDGRPYAVLAPTSRWASKRWPIERFAQLIDPLRDRGFAKVIVIGSPEEEDQVQKLFLVHPPTPLPSRADLADHRFGVIDLVGGTTIGQTLALISQADLVVANDSAPLHIAVGFERPCVGLYGPTDPAVVGPYRRPEAVIRAWVPRGGPVNFRDPSLGDSLMRLISTRAVLQRLDDVCTARLEKPKRRAAHPELGEPDVRARRSRRQPRMRKAAS